MKTALLFIASTFLLSCSDNIQNSSENQKKQKTKDSLVTDNSQIGKRKRIALMEDSLFASTQLDQGMARRAIALYTSYQKIYWSDTLAPEYLYKAAEISEHLGFPTKAIELYQECYDYYPNFPHRPECLFRIGNIYEFTLNDYANAKQTYFDIVKFHKEHPIAEDAKVAMKNIGKDDIDLIREFEKKNKIKRDN